MKELFLAIIDRILQQYINVSVEAKVVKDIGVKVNVEVKPKSELNVKDDVVY